MKTTVAVRAENIHQLDMPKRSPIEPSWRNRIDLMPAVVRKHPVVMSGVVFPTMLVAIYFLVFAAPVFVSESKFVVRLSSPSSYSPVGAMLQSSGITRSQDDTFSVTDFLLSRDALRQLNDRQPLREIFGSSKADFLTRFPRPWDSNSFEGLYRYYLARIDVTHNASTGITTLRTRAFSPEQVFKLNRDLLSAASGLLARLNDRAREDAVGFSQREMSTAEQKLLDVQSEIAKFRNKELMIDPSRLSIIMLDTIGRLSTELAMTRARRTEAESSAPGSTMLPDLTNRIAALEEQVDHERAKLVGKDTSVSAQIAEYERLTLMREIESKALISATTALENARADAQRQQLYLEPIVEPNYPDEATEPLTTTHIFVTFLLGASFSLIGWILWMAIAEHGQNRKLLHRSEATMN
jgi:capsular polysaccharide transport system permease protein